VATLQGYVLWRTKHEERAAEVDGLEGDAEALAALTEGALVARRAGYTPSLSDLAASPLDELAWIAAAKHYRAELAWEAEGIRPEGVVDHLHDLIHEHAKQLRARKRGA